VARERHDVQKEREKKKKKKKGEKKNEKKKTEKKRVRNMQFRFLPEAVCELVRGKKKKRQNDSLARKSRVTEWPSTIPVDVGTDFYFQ
jgi:hypothetical protein